MLVLAVPYALAPQLDDKHSNLLFTRYNMAKEELIEMQGSVTEVLPDSRFRVTLEN